jgi:type IV pilus assembly protein PilV
MLMTQYRKNLGFSLIEVLVTIIILSIGLLGLAGLQGRALMAQVESYQRSQALVLIKDMTDRIDANRKNAASYVTAGTTFLGTGSVPQTPAYCAGLATLQARDSCEWNNALLGTAEIQGASATSCANCVGAMTGARGCIYQLLAPVAGVPTVYQVVVAWQGMNPTAIPNAATPTSITSTSAGRCAANQYKDSKGVVLEKLHRVISMPVSVGDLH